MAGVRRTRAIVLALISAVTASVRREELPALRIAALCLIVFFGICWSGAVMHMARSAP